jgi:hypothetical protein
MGFFLIDEPAVHHQLDADIMFLVSGKRLRFLDGIASVRNLFEENLSFRIRPGSHNDFSVRTDQRELHAGKRPSVLVMLRKAVLL